MLEPCSQVGYVKHSQRTNTYLHAVFILDVNEDHYDDVVVIRRSAFSCDLKIFLNYANGQLNDEKVYPCGSELKYTTKGDMNNDGRTDLISVRHDKGDISILYNTGNGTFTETIISLGRVYANFLDVADMNGDNQLDIIVTAVLQDNVVIFYQITNGKFIEKSIYQTKEPYFLQVTDVNNDQIPDITVSHKKANISVLINKGNETFLQQLIDVNLDYSTFSLADMNNDNCVDIITGDLQSNFQISFNAGNGTFLNPRKYPVLMAYHAMSISDINNDGTNDIILLHREFSEISILANMKNHTFITQMIFLMNTDAKHVGAIDINGDRRMEMIAISSSSDEPWIAILSMTCNGT